MRLTSLTDERRDAETAPVVRPPPSRRQSALIFLAVAGGILLLQQMQAIVIPFVLSALLFYALNPTVDRLQRVHVPRMVAAGLMLLVFTGGVALSAYTLQDQARTLINDLPEAARKVGSLFPKRPGTPGAIDKVQQAADALQQSTSTPAPPRSGVMRVQVEQPRFQASQFLWSSSVGVVVLLNQMLMILFLTFFMLVSAPRLKVKLMQVVGPTLSRKRVTVQILDDIAARIEQFLVVQLFSSTVVAAATWAALWWLGLERPALWGLLAGVFNSIPYYGPLLVTGGLAAVGFLQFGTIGQTAAIAGTALAITSLEGMLLTPMLMGKVAKMNHVAIFAGLLFWSWVWGVWGMLLAVPMMMVVKTICDHIESLNPFGTLLGE